MVGLGALVGACESVACCKTKTEYRNDTQKSNNSEIIEMRHENTTEMILERF